MTVIVEFPRAKGPRVVRIRMADDPANIIILPVVRIERYPDEPAPTLGQRARRLRGLYNKRRPE